MYSFDIKSCQLSAEIIELEFSDKNNEQDSSQSAGIFKLTFMPIKIKTSKKL